MSCLGIRLAMLPLYEFSGAANLLLEPVMGRTGSEFAGAAIFGSQDRCRHLIFHDIRSVSFIKPADQSRPHGITRSRARALPKEASK